MEPSLLFLNYIIQNTKYESLSQEKIIMIMLSVKKQSKENIMKRFQ